jgi:hypothetical protein
MIKYALLCDKGHSFESWFPSSASFDTQAKRGLVDCPACGSHRVEKQIMAPSVRLKGAVVPSQEVAIPADVPDAPAAPDQPMALMGEHAQKLRAMMRELHAHVTANTEDVGAKFADEARKIHYGETEERAIRGRATADEAEALHDEGIGFFPLPTLPDERN